MLIFARSISLRAAKTLQPGVTGRVLASFARVCDLVTDGGEVVALVWNGVGNGSLNVVLEREPGAALPAGARFVVNALRQVTGTSLSASHLRVDLATAATWDARPDWVHLRVRREQIAAGAKIIAQILTERGITLTSCGLPQTDCDALSAYPFHNPQCPELRGTLSAIRNLIGLGPGLTPAGDDWLAGWLLALHCCEDLRGRARPRAKRTRVGTSCWMRWRANRQISESTNQRASSWRTARRPARRC
ncbi:MAG: DUF2877 domain-containing protein [Chloroflexi bacterium]|nr:DUF2877 domain-containing protein [Chloroflexota bacterium]